MYDYDNDGSTCPYCGHYEAFEVGMGTTHSCDGTERQRVIEEKKRLEYNIEQQKSKKKRQEDAKFLMRSGFLSYQEAYELADPIYDEDEDYP